MRFPGEDGIRIRDESEVLMERSRLQVGEGVEVEAAA